jgi:protein SCO1/2
MNTRKFEVWVVVAVLCFSLAGCQSVPEKRYALKGKVVAVDKTRHQATIAHEEIKGFMDAMTMPLKVKDDWAMNVLAPGQSIEATLVVQGDRSWIEKLSITQASVSDAGGASGVSPKPGEAVPDFELVNQDNHRVSLAQYRGRPLLLTFIYTRCPLPDFCPLTSSNFARIHKKVRSIADLGRRPRLLTISFDPEFDTPAVLRQYGRRYMNPPDFNEWVFATGSMEEIRKAAGYFGLTYYPESGQITHNLVTALIAADGKLVQLFQGNQWTPDQIVAALK